MLHMGLKRIYELSGSEAERKSRVRDVFSIRYNQYSTFSYEEYAVNGRIVYIEFYDGRIYKFDQDINEKFKKHCFRYEFDGIYFNNVGFMNILHMPKNKFEWLFWNKLIQYFKSCI